MAGKPRRPLAPMLLAALLASPWAPAASDLEMTMEVIDDVSELDDDLLAAAAPADDVYEEDLFDLDGDGVADDEPEEEGLFSRYRDDDGYFEVLNERDGFELEDEERLSWRRFVGEDNFDLFEQVDEDDYDLIEEEDPVVDPN